MRNLWTTAATVTALLPGGLMATDSFSHGELFRAGIGQAMEIESQDLKMLFQGASDEDMRGKPHGETP